MSSQDSLSITLVINMEKTRGQIPNKLRGPWFICAMKGLNQRNLGVSL